MDWASFESLEALVDSLKIENDEKGKFFTTFNDLSIDKDILYNAANELKMAEIVKASLMALTYCYQDINSLSTHSEFNIALHTKLNYLIEKFLGRTPESVIYDTVRSYFMKKLENPEKFQKGEHFGEFDGIRF